MANGSFRTFHQAKLNPPRLGGAIVPRNHLAQALEGVWDHPLTLVSAPAGYGKTTSIRLWQESSTVPTGWLTLDRDDDDTGRFIVSFVTAVQRIDPALGRNTALLLDQPSRPEASELAEILADELWELEQHCVLVVDECELVMQPDAWYLVRRIVEAGPPHFHLVLIARNDPPLPLGRFRMRGKLLELRIPDLQFSLAETETLLRVRADIDSPASATSVHRTMHGWPAGITLVALAMRQRSTGEVPQTLASSGEGVHVLDPIADEVIDRFGDREKDAVLASALPERISPNLLAAMLECTEAESLELLEGFRAGGLCTVLSDERKPTYIFHPLFKQLFAHRAVQRLGRGKTTELHIRAAKWQVAEGNTAQAVEHYLAAGDLDAAVQHLRTAIPLALDHENWPLISRWLSHFPISVLLDHPPLALGWCWVLFFKGQFAALTKFRDLVRGKLTVLDASHSDISAWHAELSLVSSYATLSIAFAPEALVEQLVNANEALPANRPFLKGQFVHQMAWALQAAGRQNEALDLLENALASFGDRIDAAFARPALALPLVLRHGGQIPDAEAAAARVLDSVERAGLPLGASWIRLTVAWISFQRNELGGAKQHLETLMTYQDAAHSLALREALLLMARAYEIEGDRVAADGVLRRLREVLSERGATELLPAALAVEAWFSLGRGDVRTARTWAASQSGGALDQTPALMNHPAILRMRVLLGLGDEASLREALRLARAFEERVLGLRFDFRLPEVYLFQAVAQYGLGARTEAEKVLIQSLAHPAGRYVLREYLDTEHQLRPLLEDVVEQGRAPAFGYDLLRLLKSNEREMALDQASAPVQRDTGSGGLLSLLTNREIDVLTRLDQRLSYKEIADALSISPLTVKRHSSNVYAKLGARNRREAVVIARRMGWRAEP